MKLNVLLLLTVFTLLSFTSQAQRGVRIGYIDTEYILENVPEYQEATAQLDDKVKRWKSDIEIKLTDIAQKRKNLSNEKALLTKELYEERKEDIDYEEKEILDYQQKRFGPNGDLMIQKKQLIQPIQDQIFAAVQDIAANKQYDFVFDKSADVVMLYSAQRFDISELVLRSISRASKRQQADSRAARRAAEDEDVVPDYNPEAEARQKAIDDKREAREQLEDQRRQEILEERAAKKAEAEAKRQALIDQREQERQEKLAARNKVSENNDTLEPSELNEDGTPKTKEQILEERKQQKLRDREARQKELEERKQRILEEREKAQQEREAKQNNSTETDNEEDSN
ncbi:OmpH family outer membrane protein [Formosa sp. S-31]|uniref:OmpH family outer membrane protein n=1 Tax=Formosa sp. S-31 TaxID=2790949 RepID=UPI003EB9EB0F